MKIDITPGFEIHEVIGRECQLIDVVESMCAAAGPGCELAVSTFGVNAHALDRVDALISSGSVASWRLFLSDRIEHMNRTHGAAARRRLGSILRTVRLHAKVVVVTGPNMSVTALTNANLNKTTRLEALFVTPDPETAAYYLEWFAELERVGCTPGRDRGYYTGTFERAYQSANRDEPLADLLAGWVMDGR